MPASVKVNSSLPSHRRPSAVRNKWLAHHNVESASLAPLEAPLLVKVCLERVCSTLPHDSFPTAHEDSTNTMWSAYMKEAGEYDKTMTDAWKEDAKSFLVFVSCSPLVQDVHCSDNVKRPAFSP